MNNNFKPIISIITVIYNVQDSLEATILSVLNQRDYCYEYIIIDGGSTDGTVEIIKKFEDRIAYWVSEKDNGIYDAMNKGIKKAKGEYICFINSGDVLLNLPVDELKKSEGYLVAFPVKLSSGNIFIPKLSNSLKIRNTLPHQGCFYKNLEGLKYDTDLRVFADFSLNQNLYKNNKTKIQIFQYPIVAFHDMGGISHDKKYGAEIFKVVKSNFGSFYQLVSWLYFKKEGLIVRLKKIYLRD